MIGRIRLIEPVDQFRFVVNTPAGGVAPHRHFHERGNPERDEGNPEARLVPRVRGDDGPFMAMMWNPTKTEA